MKSLPVLVRWPSGQLDFSNGCLIMGILNVTPDSFSDGGAYLNPDVAVEHGLEMVQQGAAIIDVGAESSRPGAKSVPAQEQIRRAIPVIQKLRRQLKIPISIDTRDPLVAQAALDAGASMINDITALQDHQMSCLASQRQIPVVLMHMKGTPETMQNHPFYDDVVAEVQEFLTERAKYAESIGIPPERIFIDPGIGFGKTTRHNLELLKHLELFTSLGYRTLVGVSRKRFIGEITGKDSPAQRLYGTAAAVAISVFKGAAIVRVHDVGQIADVIKVVQAIQNVNASSH